MLDRFAWAVQDGYEPSIALGESTIAQMDACLKERQLHTRPSDEEAAKRVYQKDFASQTTDLANLLAGGSRRNKSKTDGSCCEKSYGSSGHSIGV